MTNNDIVQKLWNLCDDGINYSDYVTELVLLLCRHPDPGGPA